MNRRATQMAAAGAMLATLILAPRAAAHGRFPGAGQVAVDPADPSHIILRTTYGLVSTLDGGQTWSWTCGAAAGYDADAFDPVATIGPAGRVVLGHFGGLYASARDGCDYTPSPKLEGRFVVDLLREDDASILALSSNGQRNGTFDVDLWETTDGAGSWTALGISAPATFLAQSATTARSRPARIYLGGRDGPQATVLRSDDRGASWIALPVPDTNPETVPLVLAVMPHDPDQLFIAYRQPLGEDEATSTLRWTEDGGDSWTTLYEGPGELAGFTIAPDGSQIAYGGPDIGLWVAPRDALPGGFEKVNELMVHCLAWEPSGLYACADPFAEPFNLGRSDDGGRTFTGLSEITSPCGPPACEPGTSVGDTCGPEWSLEKVELRACGFGETPAATVGGGAPPPPAIDEGCGCRLPGGPSGRGVPLALLALLALRWRRRRGAMG